MAEHSSWEVKSLDYNQILFRTIDRIQALSQKEYRNVQEKAFTFMWSVKLLRASIPDEILSKKFLEEEKEIGEERRKIKNKEDPEFKEDFDNIIKLYNACINLLAETGYLYRKTQDGYMSDF